MSETLEWHVADYAYAYPAEFRLTLRRAKVGARVLDRHVPGWEQRVDLDRLRLDSPCRCVLGQVYGPTGSVARIGETDGFMIGQRALGMVRDTWEGERALYRCGFEAEDGSDDEYDALDAAWLRILLDRKADQ